MNDIYTLAHLTDVHLTPVSGFAPRYWNTKRAIGYLNWQRARRTIHRRDIADRLVTDARTLRVDHVAITGDIANLGLPAEHDAALAWLKTVGPASRVTVVPGNHDIYSILRGDRGVTRWAHYMGGEEHSLAFPFMRRVGPLAIIGINSAEETPPFVAAGKVGKDQLIVVSEMLDGLRAENVVRVVLIHHPPLPNAAPPRRALSDAVHVTRVLEKVGADLVLYGHNHRPSVDWLDTADGPLPIIGAASASAARRHGNEPLAQYNVFTFFRHQKRLRIRHTVRGLETPDGPVVRLSEHILERSSARVAE